MQHSGVGCPLVAMFLGVSLTEKDDNTTANGNTNSNSHTKASGDSRFTKGVSLHGALYRRHTNREGECEM